MPPLERRPVCLLASKTASDCSRFYKFLVTCPQDIEMLLSKLRKKIEEADCCRYEDEDDPLEFDCGVDAYEGEEGGEEEEEDDEEDEE